MFFYRSLVFVLTAAVIGIVKSRCVWIDDTSTVYLSNLLWAETCYGAEDATWPYRYDRFLVGSGTNYAGGCGVGKNRAAIYFTNIDQIPSSIRTVKSATLKLFGVTDEPSSPNNWMSFRADSPNDLWVQRITSPWVVNVTNWNTQPNTTEVNAATIPATSPSLKWGYNPVVDVTALVNDILAPGQKNYGFMLKAKVEEPYRGMAFKSYDYNNPDLRPKLELSY